LGDCGIYDKFSKASVNDQPLGPQVREGYHAIMVTRLTHVSS
jgi:hypothetical protein